MFFFFFLLLNVWAITMSGVMQPHSHAFRTCAAKCWKRKRETSVCSFSRRRIFTFSVALLYKLLQLLAFICPKTTLTDETGAKQFHILGSLTIHPNATLLALCLQPAAEKDFQRVWQRDQNEAPFVTSWQAYFHAYVSMFKQTFSEKVAWAEGTKDGLFSISRLQWASPSLENHSNLILVEHVNNSTQLSLFSPL